MAQTGRRSTTTQQSVTQLASDVQVGGDLSLSAGRDIAIIASTVAAGGNMALKAEGDITIAAAANESHFEHHRKGGGKQVDIERTSIAQQGAELSAGGNFISQSGGDTTLISSNVAAGQQAYLYAGGNLNLLAAQDVEYDLYDKKEKGSFGRRETRRDEVTDVRHVGSSITAGGDLSLISEGDQLYQNARLQSGNDLTLDAGGAITFEAVKDLHQESHEKSKSDWAWTSAKGKGTTDETLIQSQLIAQGNLAIRAADGIQIDIKEIDQNTVSQTIDAMVQADPDLAWLKQMEAQGDIDWRTVKEVHDSFDYSHSGLGVGAQLVIAIAVAAFTAGAGAAGAGASMTGATSTAGIAASNAVYASVATNTVVSTINNRGDLGAVFKDVTSSDSIKGYIVTGATAGLTAGVYDKLLSTSSDSLTQKITVNLSTPTGVAGFAANQVAQNATSAALYRVLGEDSDFSNILSGALINTFAAYGFNLVGDIGKHHGLAPGSAEKVALHALMGGLASKANGGDFALGAMAAGVNEFFVADMNAQFERMPDHQRTAMLTMSSQLVGVLTAAVMDPTGDGSKFENAAWVTRNATQYNFLAHHDMEDLSQELTRCGDSAQCVIDTWVGLGYDDLSGANLEEALKVGGVILARDLMAQISGGLDNLTNLSCATAACEGVKLELIERSLQAYARASEVSGDFEPALTLVMVGAGAGKLPGRAPGSTPAVGSASVQNAVEYFRNAGGAPGVRVVVA